MKIFTSGLLLLLTAISVSFATEDLRDQSSKGTFSIIQHYDSENGWTSYVESAGKKTTLDPTDIPWPSDYFVSPDDQWIFRIQKTGAGYNTIFLYHNNGGMISSATTRPLGELVWKFYEKKLGRKESDFYHTGFAFVSWNLKDHSLLIHLEGSSADKVPEHSLRGFPIRYDLKTGEIQG